jgi:hypothetical protein
MDISALRRVFSDALGTLVNDDQLYQLIGVMFTVGIDQWRIAELLRTPGVGLGIISYERSDLFAGERDAIRKHRYLLQYQPKAVTGIYRCPKCHSDKTIAAPNHNRSGDEETNVKVTCSRCQHHFNG